MKKIAIIGAGGHARVVYDIILKQQQFEVEAFFALSPQEDQFLGHPLLEQELLYDHTLAAGVVAIGDNWIRAQVVKKILDQRAGFEFITAIHPSASIGYRAKVGPGTVVMPQVVVGPGTHVGSHCILNTSSAIDHDGRMEDYSSIAPGATLGGNVEVGEFSAISLGAQIIHGKRVGEHSVVGAGATVVQDIPSFKVAYGTPCKVVRERAKGDSYL
jgi:sugar O-acyltransferase (sialic acid O-acetyltransferase NeuD family)